MCIWNYLNAKSTSQKQATHIKIQNLLYKKGPIDKPSTHKNIKKDEKKARANEKKIIRLLITLICLFVCLFVCLFNSISTNTLI